MKKQMMWKTSTIAGLLLSLSACGKPKIVIPAAQSLPDSLVSVTVPDVHKTIDAIQKLSDQILPENLQVDLKAKLGASLNDPQLSSIPNGSGALCIWDGILWYAALECDPKQNALLSQFASDSKLLGAVEGNLFLLAKYPQGIAAAKAQAPAITQYLKNRKTAGIYVDLKLSELVEKFRPQINLAIMMLPNMMAQGVTQSSSTQVANAQSMAKISEAEIRIFASLGSQIEHLEIQLLPLEEGVEIIHNFTAKEASNLYAVITAPDSVKPDPKISVEALPPGVFEIEMFVGNPEAMQGFGQQEFQQLIKEMPLEEAHISLWEEMFALWPNFFNGSMVETFTMVPEAGVTMGYLVSVQENDTLLRTLENLPALTEPFMEMYREMGMPMNVEVLMDARKYKNHSVHQYNIQYDLENMDPLVAEQLKAMNFSEMKSEFTIADNRWLWTMGDFPLDNLIDAVEKGKKQGGSLEAKAFYPKGGICYYDIDMDAYLDYIISLMILGEADEIFQSWAEYFENSPPLVGAFYKQENRVQSRLLIPAEMLQKSSGK